MGINMIVVFVDGIFVTSEPFQDHGLIIPWLCAQIRWFCSVFHIHKISQIFINASWRTARLIFFLKAMNRLRLQMGITLSIEVRTCCIYFSSVNIKLFSWKKSILCTSIENYNNFSNLKLVSRCGSIRGDVNTGGGGIAKLVCEKLCTYLAAFADLIGERLLM